MIAILGSGITGKAVKNLLDKLSEAYVVFDEDPKKGVQTLFSREWAKHCKTVIYSPGFSNTHPWIQAAKVENCICLTDIEYACKFWQGPIIAITGTNGKTTLTRFLVHALNRAGIQAYAGGNIGTSPAQLIADGVCSGVLVCEISSFQAACIQSLQVDAVIWTNFSEDHLDVHTDLQAYFEAKWNLCNNLKPSGFLILNKNMQTYLQHYQKQPPPNTRMVAPSIQGLVGTCFEKIPQSENYELVKVYWLQMGYSLSVLEMAAHSFQIANYTLQKLPEVSGVTFWNDSKGTNFSAVEAAFRSFESPVIWIGGVKYKGGDLVAFVDKIRHHIKYAFLIGEVAPELARLLESAQFLVNQVMICDSLELAVTSAFKKAQVGDRVLFSPGFSSFDMFENYKHRGRCFEKAIDCLRI
jgi:UDP-N-acetylmuramoylalanine--D-glutamate ligase